MLGPTCRQTLSPELPGPPVARDTHRQRHQDPPVARDAVARVTRTTHRQSSSPETPGSTRR
ncbi:hypothetical protein BDV95DRAFT_562539 [Massariosphaeria phaeospora]|uniref:Uncharacterized protein n=1 Tax=Massariosphaeria phaeospora TaxID=100035 RepID=A0A7C8ILJ3_9PLEO|nr:hypothetical protein BDV95DRAFT_562539 [Massariosphaeria phaeospora]